MRALKLEWIEIDYSLFTDAIGGHIKRIAQFVVS